MLHVIKFVIDLKQLALKLKPTPLDETVQWELIAYSDSYFAGDKDQYCKICVVFDGCTCQLAIKRNEVCDTFVD